MISFLRGTLLSSEPGLAIVECAGVGYGVGVSSHTQSELPEVGQEVRFRVFTHFQDHKISLYGFSGDSERDLFDLLITVKNVGPSSAMKILSAGAGPVEIAQLIAAENVAALKSIKGVGKKTAELLVVELNEKCQQILALWGASNADVPAAKPAKKVKLPVHSEVQAALVQMGWKLGEAEKAVETLPPDPNIPLEDLLRKALQAMPRS
jgi:Holliday junction DNA helicase RuvA